MEWIKLLKQSIKPKYSFDPIIENYVVKFSGLFSYSKREKLCIRKRSLYEDLRISEEISEIIKNQYYPVFRKFILNDSAEDFLEIKNSNSYELKVEVSKGDWVDVVLEEGTLSFFNDEIGIGIYSYQVKIKKQLKFSQFIPFVRQMREFKTSIIFGGAQSSMIEFIEMNFLRCEDNPKTNLKLQIGKDSDVNNYSGTKLKTFISIEMSGIRNVYTIDEALYELGTLTDFRTSKRISGSHSPSEEFYSSILANKISVFENWKSLALFDSFVIIGEKGYLDNKATVDTIKGSYFKIFLFNLYTKYYLFKTNSDLEMKKSEISTDTLYSFLKRYNLSHISFNFLPNLIHNKIRSAFEIDSELLSVKSKIELIESKENEYKSNLINAILFCIACLSTVSFLADYPSVSKAITGKGDDKTAVYIGIGILILIFSAIMIWYMRKKKR